MIIRVPREKESLIVESQVPVKPFLNMLYTILFIILSVKRLFKTKITKVNLKHDFTEINHSKNVSPYC